MAAVEGSSLANSQLQHILLQESTNKYYIEYGGFLSNHLSHGIIALQRLGASQKRVDDFIKWYKPKLEDPLQNEPENERAYGEQPESLQGQRKQFYAIFNKLKTRLENEVESIDELIRQEFPKVQLGMACSALHGLIHLGYGHAAKSTQIALEGLAYLYHSYRPIIFSETEYSLKRLGVGTHGILEVVNMVREDKTLTEKMFEEENSVKWQAINIGSFQRRHLGLLQVAGNQLLDLVYKIKFPEWFDENVCDMSQAIKLSDWVLDCAIIVYTKSSRPNDFILIHGVTGAWSLRQVILTLQSYSMAMKCIRTYLALLLAAYVARLSPILNVEVDPVAPGGESDWKDVIAQTLALEVDEHIYKLVQVCNERCLENPNDGALYISAAKSAIQNPLILFIPKNE